MADAPNFANRTMWTRDNLDVLRGLNSESIDLVYADPPFNSNKNYEAPIGSKTAGAAFKDPWTLSDVDLAWHGEIADREPRVYAAIEAAGVVHRKSMRSYLTDHRTHRTALAAVWSSMRKCRAITATGTPRESIPATAALDRPDRP